MIILEKFEERNCEYHNLKFFSKILNLEDYYKRTKFSLLNWNYNYNFQQVCFSTMESHKCNSTIIKDRSKGLKQSVRSPSSLSTSCRKRPVAQVDH